MSYYPDISKGNIYILIKNQEECVTLNHNLDR